MRIAAIECPRAWVRRIVVAGTLGVAALSPSAQATVVTDCPGGTCSLQELFDGSTIQINDLVFERWQLFVLDTIGVAPMLSMIEVIPLAEAVTPGLRYAANGQLTVGGLADNFLLLDFGYVIRTDDGVPRITDNSLTLQEFSFSGGGGVIDIGEVACRDGFEILAQCNNLVVDKAVFADNLNAAFSLVDSAFFAPEAALFVETAVFVLNDNTGDEVELRTFDQRFSRVPEPATLVLLGVGLAAVFLRGRRRHVG
jgi:hypothetical protein